MALFMAFVLIAFSSDSLAKPSREKDSLNGTWDVVAVVSADGPELWKKGKQHWVFTKNTAIFHAEPGVSGIPIDGSEFDLIVDYSTSPKRLKLSSRESDKSRSEDAFAYCIWDQKDETLMIRILWPLALGSSSTSEKARKAFLKSHYPKSFKVQPNDGSAAFILHRR